MATETRDIPVLADDSRPPSGSYRPGLPIGGVGRWLRWIAGVKEDILDWTPEERPRYTRLGAIVLNTGLMAALSLMAGLTSVVEVHWMFLVPIAVFWGFVIVSFDSWLISSTHGVLDSAKIRVFVPRLVISILMGFVIAEPLLLWVFKPAIHREVLSSRAAEIAGYESTWKNCNPVIGQPADQGRCQDFQLNLRNSPESVKQQLVKATAERNDLKTTVDRINAEFAKKEDLAQGECSGRKGRGLTGVPGDGGECKRNRRIADQYRADSRLAERQSHLTKLDRDITALTAKLAAVTKTYGEEVNTAIAKKVTTKESEQGRIGILEEDKALGRLSAQSAFVLLGSWLVRILLVVIDCLPVLTKLMSSTTTYDQLISRELAISKRLHDKHVNLRERRDAAVSDVGIKRTDYERQMSLERVDEADRASRANREADLDAQIDELAARLRRQGLS